MRRLTGHGKVENLVDGSTLLFNYNIDDEELKPEHKAWLDKNVVAVARANPKGVSVVLDGAADRLGDAHYNDGLSMRRAKAVVAYLKRQLPNYPWDFRTEWHGESKAERAGDTKGMPDEVFRAVMIQVLKPGQPVPKRPRLHQDFPKKPNVFPRVVPLPIARGCLPEAEIPLSQDFSIMLIVGGTGGEIVEGAFFTFMVQDQSHRLACLYTLTGGGLATPGLPISPSGAGKPSPFHTDFPTKLTRFGPIGGITSATVGPPGSPPVGPQNKTLFTVLGFSVKPPDSSIPRGKVLISDFDTGPISIQGGGIHGGHFKPHSVCQGGLGADVNS